MAKSIKIKLIPAQNAKIYQPQPGYADLHILMNKLHFTNVYEAITEEEKHVSKIELHQRDIQETINNNHKTESALNILQDNLECINKLIKKQQLKGNKLHIEYSNLENINKMIDEIDIKSKGSLNKLYSERFENDINKFMTDISNNLEIIEKDKADIIKHTENLLLQIQKIETLKENINSSQADIDSLDIAINTLKIS